MAGESKPAIAKSLNINRSTFHMAWKAYKECATTKIWVLSDEKDFHVDKYVKRRNKRILAKSSKAMSLSKRYVGRSKFSKKAMFGYVSSDGTAFLPVWVKGTMDAAQYT